MSGTDIDAAMDPFNIEKLPIEIREHILSYIEDISLIPDGLSEGFWKKWFLKHSVDRVLFASWKKSAKIIQDYNTLDEKRKILALLDWKTMYVATLADITIKKEFADYKIEKEVIAAAGRTGLCMLVKPANMEDESYLDITPRSSIMEDHYTGEFTFTSEIPLEEQRKNNRILHSKGVVAWYHHNYRMNKTLYKVVYSILEMYRVRYNLKGFRIFPDEDGNVEEIHDEEYNNYGFDDEYIFEDENDEEGIGLRYDKYVCAYGQQLPVLSQSLVYTKDPQVFEKPHVIEMFYRRNHICSVKDRDGILKAFIVCVPTWDQLHNLLCMGDQLCYFITGGGNIYFEASDIYKKYMKRFFNT